jgi:hypothetical protein
MQWTHWPCVFPQHGPGRKHNRKIALEDWQQKIVDRHSGMFLRSLFHSDGSRFVNGNRKLTPWRYLNTDPLCFMVRL